MAKTKAGDRVAYMAFGAEPRVGTITESFPDIRKGRPGFLMTTDDGQSVWGYDHQIIAVNTEQNPH